MYKIFVICICIVFLSATAHSTDHLLYFEAQGIAGYSTEIKKTIFYTMKPDAEMQKPSIGFDYLKRFSGDSGDWATLALQGRLAMTEDLDKNENGNTYRLEYQVYNAYLKKNSVVLCLDWT
jgi:hypothetical protein